MHFTRSAQPAPGAESPAAQRRWVIGCPDCGAVQELPELTESGRLACCQCGNTLERRTGRSVDAALACALATFLLLFPANLLPLLSVSMAGATRMSRLGSGAIGMWEQQWVLLGIVVFLQGIVLPFFRFGLLALVLGALRLGRTHAWIGPVFRWAEQLDMWAMPDVFLIGCAIGYSRVEPFLPVHIRAGGWCFIAAAFLTMLTRASLDRRAIWRLIAAPPAPDGQQDIVACTECGLLRPAEDEGERCPRCRARLWRRKPYSMMRMIALVTAGYLLYPVANIYPMSIAVQLGRPKPHTIFDGVLQLIGAGLWPLAAIIFTVSIGIPVLKLAGLTWFFISVKQGSRWGLVARTRLYRAIDGLGRWSNIDVFTIAIFLPLMQFGQLATVFAAKGAVAFLAVVVLTMFAARVFDPRLMWDAAAEKAP